MQIKQKDLILQQVIYFKTRVWIVRNNYPAILTFSLKINQLIS